MACEVTVKVKDKLKSMTQKTMVYNESVIADFTHPKIDELVAKATKNFGGDMIGLKTTVTIKLIEE